MDIICPKGHHSTDPDYCSECGAKIEGTPSGITTPTANLNAAVGTAGGSTDEICPDCGTKRANPGAVFCEVCRYNFATHMSWSAPAVADLSAPALDVAAPPMPDLSTPGMPDVSAQPSSAPSSTGGAPTLAGGFLAWDAVVSVDGSLYTQPDPNLPLPTDPERTFALDLAENLIGRRSDKRDIHPEINVNGSGVSHRHAKLLREPDGSFVIVDVGSTNGTILNGAPLDPGVRTPVHDGDQITLGYWTRIVIRGRAA